jgi:hypothetical protein
VGGTFEQRDYRRHGDLQRNARRRSRSSSSTGS